MILNLSIFSYVSASLYCLQIKFCPFFFFLIFDALYFSSVACFIFFFPVGIVCSVEQNGNEICRESCGIFFSLSLTEGRWENIFWFANLNVMSQNTLIQLPEILSVVFQKCYKCFHGRPVMMRCHPVNWAATVNFLVRDTFFFFLQFSICE